MENETKKCSFGGVAGMGLRVVGILSVIGMIGTVVDGGNYLAAGVCGISASLAFGLLLLGHK